MKSTDLVPAVRRRGHSRRVAVLCLGLTLLACNPLLGADGHPAKLPNPQNIPLNGPIHFQARNIVFHVMDGVHLDVQSVDALLVPSSMTQPVTLDDPNSMRVRMQSGETSISGNNQPLFVVDGVPVDNSQFLGTGGSRDFANGVGDAGIKVVAGGLEFLKKG